MKQEIYQQLEIAALRLPSHSIVQIIDMMFSRRINNTAQYLKDLSDSELLKLLKQFNRMTDGRN